MYEIDIADFASALPNSERPITKMEIDRELADHIYHVAEQYEDREQDWPAIQQALRVAPGVDLKKAVALLVGLRALERLKDSPARTRRIKAARSLLQWQKGRDAKSYTRRQLRALALSRYDRLQNLLLLGFMIDGGSGRVSRPTIRALADALSFVLHVPPNAASPPDELLYQRIRLRLHRGRSSNVDEAEALVFFRTVYAMVFE
jgi:hypothetical protein